VRLIDSMVKKHLCGARSFCVCIVVMKFGKQRWWKNCIV